MLKNHLKIAWRNLKTNRLFSTINILGLSIGLCIVFVLSLFILNEKSFDSMYSKKDRIHRVLVETNGEFGDDIWATAPPVVASTMKKEITNVVSAGRMLKHGFGETASIRVEEKNFTESFLYWVDEDILDIFDIEIVKGAKENALSRPKTVIISESTAKIYFDEADPIGKTIIVDSNRQLEVTGVFKDFPNNSTLDCNVMASSKGYWFYKSTTWSNSSFETYCLLKENVSLDATIAQMKQMHNDNVPKEDQWYSLSLQSLNDVHLYSANYGNAYSSRIGDISEVRNLIYLAILILLIACMNYMNLTTARSQKRSKEVGISKTLGASSGSLVTRFYIETGLITAISMIIGLVLTALVLPSFNALTNQNLELNLLLNGTFLTGIFVVWLLTTIVSGSYPAMYLSRFLPKEILAPSLKQGKSNTLIRKSLVVLQFAASVILIVGVQVIYKQTQFIQNKDLGFSPENVVAIPIKGLRGEENKDALIQEFKSLSDVKSVATAQGFPSIDVSGRMLRQIESDKEYLNIQTNVSDADILEVLQLTLLAGKSLPKNKNEKDTLVEVVLNKKAIDYLGFSPEEAIGKEVNIGTPNTIVGVVDNFNFASLHQPIGAYAFHNNTGESKSYLLARFNAGNTSNTINQMEKAFNKVVPNLAFDYTFLDQNLAKLYEREKRASNVGMVFCLLAIFIASLGLFGLAAFMAEQRRKEIGVRKVLGATILGITQMLSLDFLKLVAVALVIAFPVAYFLMDNWLQEFAYKINLGWMVFVISGILALTIALVTVSFQAVKAAVVNPIKSLRTE